VQALIRDHRNTEGDQSADEGEQPLYATDARHDED